MTLRIAIVGMSTTGKSKVADDIRTDITAPIPHDTQVIDSDEWVAEQILGDNRKPGIGRVFTTLGRTEALKRIKEEENRFLAEFAGIPDNAIFALGPWLGLRSNWAQFRPTVRLIKINKDAPEVLNGLRWRRQDRIRNELSENFPELLASPNYGCWDVNVTVNKDLADLPDDRALANVEGIIGDMDSLYRNAENVTYPVSPADIYRVLGLTGPAANT